MISLGVSGRGRALCRSPGCSSTGKAPEQDSTDRTHLATPRERSATLVTMGIRYYAYSIDTEDYEHLLVGVCPTCGEQPQLREMEDDRPTLALDKSWHDLQALLRAEPARPAAALVAGNVTNTYWGWRSHRGLLSPAEVREIAADIATVTTDFLRQRILVEGRHGDGPDERSQQDFEYVSDHLAHAKEFTKEVADQGRAIVYYIG